MSEKIIFCFIGKSSSGKDTIKKMILEKDSTIKNLVPFTTRPPRFGEIDGIDYQFIKNDDSFSFDSPDILEHRKYKVKKENGDDDIWVYGHYKPSFNVSLMIGTLDVFRSIRNNKEIKIIPIYIYVDDEERLYRMFMRENQSKNPNFRELSRRYIKDNEDFNNIRLGRYGIHTVNSFLNDNLEKCADNIYNYIQKIIN